MLDLKYTEIVKKNRELQGTVRNENRYSISVLSNIMVSQLKDVLEYSLRANGIGAEVILGHYDNIVKDSMEFKNSNAVIVFWELANIVDGLETKINLSEDRFFDSILEKVKSEFHLIAYNLSKCSLVILNKFSTTAFNGYYLVKNKFDELCEILNDYISKNKQPNTVIVDIEKIISRVSIDKSFDLRYYYSSKTLYSIEFLKYYSHFVKPIFKSSCGKAKKAAIFDCDNTLWKGILEEDGLQSIKIYKEIQSLIVELRRMGVIIGLCSKNNLSDIDYILENNEDMVLKNIDITIKKVNWNDKASNLMDISRELNIGLDSLVFFDDSEFEINLVREKLPEVTAVKVPDYYDDYIKELKSSLNLFYNLSGVGMEDMMKTQIYKEQLLRSSEMEKFKSIEDYLESLDMKLTVLINEEIHIQRASQLTQKTNQFNLTTKRYTNSDIENMVKSGNHLVVAIDVNDRFGSNGVTGLSIVKVDGQKAVIDTFLLSCRVLGRNIEYKFFDVLLNELKNKNVDLVESCYIKTVKNVQTENFYDKLGFKQAAAGEGFKQYYLNISEYQPKNICYIGVDYCGRQN